MKRTVLIVFFAAAVLALVAWPTYRARAEDDAQGDDCGAAVSAEDDDSQGGTGTEGDASGCGMVVVEVDDENGTEVDDMNDDGTTDDDVGVDVEETVSAQGGATATQVVQFHTTRHGSFVLAGLPTGRATITATRVHNGLTTVRARKVRVRQHRTKRLHLRLRPAR